MFKFSGVVFDYRRCSLRLAVGLIVLPLLSLMLKDHYSCRYFLWHQRKYRLPLWFFGIKESIGKSVFFVHKESNGITDLQIKQFQFLLLTKISIITTFVEIKTTNVVIR